MRAERGSTHNGADPECGGFEGQRCTAKGGNGNVTSFTYDGHGNLIRVKLPAPLGETTYTYDALGRVERSRTAAASPPSTATTPATAAARSPPPT
ncbi:RHS repeat domain-containing protein [Streptomyces sp. NPDC085944]|uniref:RHS repeat domain-containing protein n=1 Tax=Streptomyces sp. NPDC085944 TaxID=3154962 RepID=UPI0034288392